jgi:hypothetical protein
MHMRPVRLGLAPEALLGAGAGIQHRLEHAIAQRLRERPRQTGRGDAIEGERHRAAGNPQRSADRPVGGAASVLEPQDLSYASHRHPLGWHRLPRPSLVRDGQEAADPPSGRATATLKGWPTSHRNGRHHLGNGGRLHLGISGRVGTEIAPRPPHRSGRAAFPHPALPESAPRGQATSRSGAE